VNSDNIRNVRLIDLPKIIDERGNLTFLESEKHIPFKISRVYWIYDVPGGVVRGSHAFKEQKEMIIALSGSFDVVLNDGTNEKKYSLNRSYIGLYIPNMIWRSIMNFSTNSLCLVISSHGYNENDYLRNFDKYKEMMVK
jgi:dTDP-4-dehydrorhamnose 3,5-epimerase-like enzyme